MAQVIGTHLCERPKIKLPALSSGPSRSTGRRGHLESKPMDRSTCMLSFSFPVPFSVFHCVCLPL